MARKSRRAPKRKSPKRKSPKRKTKSSKRKTKTHTPKRKSGGRKRKLSAYNVFVKKHLKTAIRGSHGKFAARQAMKKVAAMWRKSH